MSGDAGGFAAELAAEHELPAVVRAALVDLYEGTAAGDGDALGRWLAHSDAARAEGLCPLTGDSIAACRFHRGPEATLCAVRLWG